MKKKNRKQESQSETDAERCPKCNYCEECGRSDMDQPECNRPHYPYYWYTTSAPYYTPTITYYSTGNTNAIEDSN